MFRILMKATAMILLGTLSLSAQDSTRAARSVPRFVKPSALSTTGETPRLPCSILSCKLFL